MGGIEISITHSAYSDLEDIELTLVKAHQEWLGNSSTQFSTK